MAPSDNNLNPTQPVKDREHDGSAATKGSPPAHSGWAELWKAYARVYGPYSFGMVIVISIMGGMSADLVSRSEVTDLPLSPFKSASKPRN